MLTCSVQICYTGTCAIRYLNFPTRSYGPIVFLLTEIKPEYSDMLYNPTHFSGSLVYWIRKTPLYIYRETISKKAYPLLISC